MARLAAAKVPNMQPGAEFYLSQCAGKKRFVNPKLAHRALVRSHKKGRQAYRCQHCGGWHLGTTETVR